MIVRGRVAASAVELIKKKPGPCGRASSFGAITFPIPATYTRTTLAAFAYVGADQFALKNADLFMRLIAGPLWRDDWGRHRPLYPNAARDQ